MTAASTALEAFKRGTYLRIKDLSAEITNGRTTVLNRCQELAERINGLEDSQAHMTALLERVVAANARLSVENDALLKALGLRALKAMTAPVRLDEATISRLIDAVGREPWHVPVLRARDVEEMGRQIDRATA